MPTKIDPVTGERTEVSMEEFMEVMRQADGQVSIQQVVTKADGSKRVTDIYGSASGSEDGLDRSLTVFTDGPTVEAFMAKALSGQKEPEPKPQDYGGYKGFVMTVDYLDKALTAVVTVTEQKVKLEHFVRDERRSNSEREYHGEWIKRNGQLQIDQNEVQRDKRILYILVFHEMRKYLRRLGLLDQLKTLDNRSAGVLLTSKGNGFSAKLVRGKDRPELPCVIPLLGEQMCRPYPDELILGNTGGETRREKPTSLRETSKDKYKQEDSKATESEGREAEKKEEENRIRYERTVETMKKADSAIMFRAAADAFSFLSGYRDSDERRKQCLRLAEEKGKEEEREKRYEKALADMEQAAYPAQFRMLADTFHSLRGYRDAAALEQTCLKKAEEAERMQHQKRLSSQSAAGEVRRDDTKSSGETEKTKGPGKGLLLILAAAAVVVILVVALSGVNNTEQISSLAKTYQTIGDYVIENGESRGRDQFSGYAIPYDFQDVDGFECDLGVEQEAPDVLHLFLDYEEDTAGTDYELELRLDPQLEKMAEYTLQVPLSVDLDGETGIYPVTIRGAFDKETYRSDSSLTVDTYEIYDEEQDSTFEIAAANPEDEQHILEIVQPMVNLAVLVLSEQLEEFDLGLEMKDLGFLVYDSSESADEQDSGPSTYQDSYGSSDSSDSYGYSGSSNQYGSGSGSSSVSDSYGSGSYGSSGSTGSSNKVTGAGAGGYDLPNESDESFSDYVKRVDPDLYNDMTERYDSLTD